MRDDYYYYCGYRCLLIFIHINELFTSQLTIGLSKSLTPLKLHDNASEAYPSVYPNPNAWEFLQNIQYYQYGAYYNIRFVCLFFQFCYSLKCFRNFSQFWDRVITCGMDRYYQEGEQRTFFIPTNDAFKVNGGKINHK